MLFVNAVPIVMLHLVLQEVLEGREGSVYPAARVAPTKGELFWLLDDPAAASLSIHVERPGSGETL